MKHKIIDIIMSEYKPNLVDISIHIGRIDNKVINCIHQLLQDGVISRQYDGVHGYFVIN